MTTTGRHRSRSANAGARRATRYTPALTIVAECRYALTGVGATIAPGSQAWNGICADLVNAPSRISTRATVTASPPGRVGEDGAEPVRAGGLAEDDEAGEHRQRAGAGDQQGLQGGGPGLRDPRGRGR